MKYTRFGNTGLRVSEAALGTMTFGEKWGWGSSPEEARNVFDTYVEAGGNFFDTANKYTEGQSETILGDLVRSERERFVIASKFTLNMRAGDPNAGGNHRKNIMQSIDATLKRMKIDYLDLYWLHAWDYLTPVDEVLRALDDLVRVGKVHYIGISDTPAWIISQANTLAALKGMTAFAGVQLEYNLIERTVERELLPMAKEFDLGVVAWSPLANGLLTGKYLQGSQSNQASSGRLDKQAFTQISERNLKIAGAIVEIAKELNKSPAQVALNWIRRNKRVIPLLGARTVNQLKDNLATLTWELPQEHLARLDAASAIELGFPHDFLGQDHVRQLIYGDTLSSLRKASA